MIKMMVVRNMAMGRLEMVMLKVMVTMVMVKMMMMMMLTWPVHERCPPPPCSSPGERRRSSTGAEGAAEKSRWSSFWRCDTGGYQLLVRFLLDLL